MFKSLITQYYQNSIEYNDTAIIDDHKRETLQYAAGNVCQHVRERSRHILREELILCLMTLTKGGEFKESQGTDKDWTELLDCEGLWHIQKTFHLFCDIEEEVQLQLKSLPRQTWSIKYK